MPCYNERPNVAPLVEKLEAALPGIAWEIMFVDDDSPDGTAAGAPDRGARPAGTLYPADRAARPLLCGDRGRPRLLSPFLAVMDGDLQHDETRLPVMLAALRGRRVRPCGRQPSCRGRR